MRHVGFVLLLLGISVAPVGANTLNSDGYRTSGNYWYYGTTGQDAYTRTLYTAPGYYSCGLYYPGQSYYRYTLVPAVTYTAPATTRDYNVLTAKLIDFAREKDRAIARERLHQLEAANFGMALKALGLEGERQFQNYGTAVPYPLGNFPAYAPRTGYGAYGGANPYASLQLSSAGVQGNTAYGYSLNSIADVYGQNNAQILHQALGRSIDGTQKLAGDANNALAEIVAIDGEKRAKIASILARGQAIAEIAKQLDGNSARVTTRIDVQKTVPTLPQAPGVPQLPQEQQGGGLAEWQAAATQDCASCHSGARKEGGFDVYTFPSLSIERKLDVIARILHPDSNRRMPRQADGKAGPRMDSARVALWLTN